MTEEYAVVNPFAIWRRRLIIGAALIGVVASVWGIEVLYNNTRLASGPTAWFMVETAVARGSPYAASETVFSDGYPSERDCNGELRHLASAPGAPIASCRRLLLRDAAKMRRY
jgi:hypothetical protein